MTTRILSFATTLLLAFGAQLLASDWPSWRGADGNAITTESGLPSKLDPAGATWTIEIPGESTSTPIIVGETLYLTTQIGEAPIQRRREGPSGGDDKVDFVVLALSTKDGSEVWRYSLPSDGVLPSVHEKHNLASPSAVSDGERVIAWFGTGQIVSLKLDGTLEWQRHLGREIAPFEVLWAHGSSPTLFEDSVLLLCDHAPAAYLLSLDKRTGKELWRADRGDGRRSYSTPLIVPRGEGHEAIVNSDHRIDSYDPETGELLWWAGPHTRVPVGSPVWHDGVLYTSRGYRSGPYMALRTGGTGDVNESHVIWDVATGAPYTSSIIFYEGLMYMATENGIASAIDGESGETVWRERLGGYFSASPMAGDGKLYLLTEEGDAFVVKAGREFELLSKTTFPARFMASPVVADGTLYVRTDETLYAYTK